MSFLLNALGNVGKSMLGAAGGYLFKKAQPTLGRIGGWFSRVFGKKHTDDMKNVGRTAVDRLMENGKNAAFDGI